MGDERELIDRILAGDTAEWCRFIERYSGPMQRIIARYADDADVSRDLFVSLLEKLKKEKLARFDGKSSLSTWLFVVTVNHCRDYFRSSKGIRHVMTALAGLGAIERRFFKLAYLQALPLHEVLASIRAEMGRHVTYLELIECEERIVEAARSRKLGRLIERLLNPAIREQPLETWQSRLPDHAPLVQQTQPPPDIVMESGCYRDALKNLREALLRLPHRDQIILKLRFEHKASARRICEVLDLGNEKTVYRRLDSLIARLRGMLLETGIPLEIYEGIVQNLAELRSWEEQWNPNQDRDANPFH